MHTLRQIRRLVGGSLTLAVLGSGCGFGEDLDDQALLQVMTTHHPTPVDGAFPDRGPAERARVFTNDMGWEVNLTEAYITTTGVSLVDCAGAQRPLDMYWGPCADDVIDKEDVIDQITVAGREVPDGRYCRMLFEYGPYYVLDDSQHPPPLPPEKVDGLSIFLRGRAEKDGLAEVFEWKTSESRVVELSLEGLEPDGTPLALAGEDSFPTDLTVGKAYDAFFVGVDFANADTAEMEGRIMDILEDETRVVLGREMTVY